MSEPTVADWQRWGAEVMDEMDSLRADLARAVAERDRLREALDAETLVLARVADYAVGAGGWRLFYYADQALPTGVFDLSDRFNPDVSERLRAALAGADAPGADDDGGAGEGES